MVNRSITKQISIFLLFIILGFGIYSNTLNVPFIFDDESRILNNPNIRVTTFSDIGKAAFSKYSAQNRPFGNITFALNYYLHQYNLKGYHVVNIIIHVLTGIFFYLFIKTTLSVSTPQSVNPSTPESLDPSFIAFGAALAWLVHPVQTQSVTYIIQRMNSMAAMFFVLSFFLFLKGRLSSENKKRWAWFAGSAVTWLLSLGCKQISATLPFFIFLYEWYFFQDLSKDWLRRHLKYLFGVALLFGFISFLYLGLDPLEKILSLDAYARHKFTFTERVLTQFRVVVYYLSLLFYPHPSRLNLDYDFPLSHSLVDPITTLFSLGIIVMLLGSAFYLAKKERLISFCILWFLGNLVIESTVIPLDIIYEHRVYLPSMLVFLLAAMLAGRYIRPKWLVSTALCTVVIICSVWTYERNAVWNNGIAFWQDCVEKSRNKARPHINLGNELENRGEKTDAFRHYSKAVQLDPENPKGHYNLGKNLATLGKRQEAVYHYSEAVR